jgi:hypothetical protein
VATREQLIERHDDSRIRDLLVHPEKDGLVVICAWCESVRTSEDVWLPIGHFVPRAGPVAVTHGLCPPCALGLHRPLRDEPPRRTAGRCHFPAR